MLHLRTFMSILILTGILSALLAFAEDEPVMENARIADGNVWMTEDGVKYFTCPVMKGELKVEDADAYSDHNGKRYYHCCPPCQGPFRDDPESWLKELVLPGNLYAVDENGNKHYRDPVNGKTGKVKAKTRYVDHEGKRYFFSKKKTMEAFKEQPEKYLKQTS